MHEVQAHHRRVVLDLLGEPVGQSRETPHGRSHREVVALDVGSPNLLRVGVSSHDANLDPGHFVGGVAAGCWTRILGSLDPVLLDHLRVINLGPEHALDRSGVSDVTIGGQLDPVGQPRLQVVQEVQRLGVSAPANQPRRDQLGIRVNGGPRPYVAVAPVAPMLLGTFLALA